MTNKTRHIALAIDPMSEEALTTIYWAMENFLRPTDTIHAIMVMVLDTEFTENDANSFELPPTDSLEEIEKEVTEKRLKEMNELVTKITDKGFSVKKHVFKADSSRACNILVDYLSREKMDCLIMGSRNLSGWKRFFTGSFSDYVQTHVDCPVLIVK